MGRRTVRGPRGPTTGDQVLQSATLVDVKSISQRELRNDSAEVLRAVERGEAYVVTRRGVPVAMIGPLRDTDLTCRPARKRHRIADLPRVRSSLASEDVLRDLRSE